MQFKNWFLINEINWEKDFSDVEKTCEDPKKIVDYLNAVRANSEIEYGKREKFPETMPFVHAKSRFFKGKDLDIDYFIEQITKPPTTIVNTNEKILKSGGLHEFVYKTGVPAFRGIVYDIENKKFAFVNTCPGAGHCVVICYAKKGRYIQYPEAYDSMTRRLNYLLNYPEKYEEQLYKELEEKCKEHEALKGYKSKVILRWNDSGDFFTKRYLQIASRVMKDLDKEGYNISSYAYTKIADVAKESPFGDATFSSGGALSQSKQIDSQKQKMSVIVPTELFKGLNLMRIDDEKKLKDNVAKHFNISKDEIITYDELMLATKLDFPKWHVIVTPNDGDDAAFRKDVKTIFLTQH